MSAKSNNQVAQTKLRTAAAEIAAYKAAVKPLVNKLTLDDATLLMRALGVPSIADITNEVARRLYFGLPVPKIFYGIRNKINPAATASRLAKAAISAFDNDFDLDVDVDDIKRLTAGEKRRKQKQKNPVDPLTAFAAGTSGLLSAMQIKKLLAEEATHKRRKRKNPDVKKAYKNSKYEIGDEVLVSIGNMQLPAKVCGQLYTPETGWQYIVSAGPDYQNTLAKTLFAENDLHGINLNPRTNPKTFRRPTFEQFQGRPATKVKQMAVSRYAPDKLDCLGDLIELKLTDGRVLRPHSPRFKLCAGNGKLWIAGGRFANPGGGNNALNVVGEIEHVVYGTQKTHLGDKGYTHYIHTLGEETGHKPVLAVDQDGFPVIRGGRYKIESRGIVN